MNHRGTENAEGIRDEEALNRVAHQIIGAAIELHRELGPGYLESVYEEALAIEFSLRHIPYSRQHAFSIEYKNRPIGESRLDFLVDDLIIVELKAVEALLPVHTAQAISYLKATDKKLALLINFNVQILKQGIKRVILS